MLFKGHLYIHLSFTYAASIRGYILCSSSFLPSGSLQSNGGNGGGSHIQATTVQYEQCYNRIQVCVRCSGNMWEWHQIQFMGEASLKWSKGWSRNREAECTKANRCQLEIGMFQELRAVGGVCSESHTGGEVRPMQWARHRQRPDRMSPVRVRALFWRHWQVSEYYK